MTQLPPYRGAREARRLFYAAITVAIVGAFVLGGVVVLLLTGRDHVSPAASAQVVPSSSSSAAGSASSASRNTLPTVPPTTESSSMSPYEIAISTTFPDAACTEAIAAMRTWDSEINDAMTDNNTMSSDLSNLATSLQDAQSETDESSVITALQTAFTEVNGQVAAAQADDPTDWDILNDAENTVGAACLAEKL